MHAHRTLAPADIHAAAGRIAGRVERTPCRFSRTLSAITGAEVWVKFENLQFTASFKERGALNRLLQLTDGEKAREEERGQGSHGLGSPVVHVAGAAAEPAAQGRTAHRARLPAQPQQGSGRDLRPGGSDLAGS